MYEHLEIRGFDRLTRLHGYEKYANVSLEVIEKYKTILPDFILAIWERHGLSSHGEGYIWTVNPDDYIGIVQDFFGKKRELIVFARSSFGDMYCVEGGKKYVIQPQIGEAIFIGDSDIEYSFKYSLIMLDDENLKRHLKARKKLGPIEHDQMYGYVPMLALGGDGSLKETKIVKTKEYLALVADVVTEANRNDWDPLELNEDAGR